MTPTAGPVSAQTEDRSTTMNAARATTPISGRRRRAVAVVAAGLVALTVAACGGGSSSTGTTAATSGSTDSVVTPPAFTLQGCTYVLDGKVPTGEPTGLKPHFPSFSPDPSARAALRIIKGHGGTAMVDGVTLPAGTTLHAGPDTSGTKVGTIPSGQSILAAEPVVWTDSSGHTWLAFFLSCGGDNLYWVSLSELAKQNPSIGESLASLVSELAKAPPYTKSGQASLLPIVVDDEHHLVFADPKVTFSVGRGELVSAA